MSTRRLDDWRRQLQPEPDPHLTEGCDGDQCGCQVTDQQWRAGYDNAVALYDVAFDGCYTTETR